MEHYGQIMNLDILFNTIVEKADYNESERVYHIQTQSSTGRRTFIARHVVLATGVFSDDPIIPNFPDQDVFKGELYHSSNHKSAAQIPNLHDKKVVVIGPGTSGHDVAQDFVSSGAKVVSIIQRHPIFVLSTESSEALQLKLWNIEGISTEEADLIGNSFPLAVIRTMSIPTTQQMAEIDKDMLEGLKRAGFAVKSTEDGFGLADHQLIKGGQFYIDQGASQMIIDGRIKLYRCEEGIKKFHDDGLTLSDGRKLEADIVVLATGYQNNIKTVEKPLGKDIAKGLDNFGSLDDEQERAGVSTTFKFAIDELPLMMRPKWWRTTGIPAFWYMTGSFMWSRQFSLALALQITASIKCLTGAHP